MDVKRLTSAGIAMCLLAGVVGGAAAQDSEPTTYDMWRTKELQPGVLRIVDDNAGHDLTRKWPRNHYGYQHVAVGPDGDVWLSVSVPTRDPKQSVGARLWPLGREKTYGTADGLGQHHHQMAFDEAGRLWVFGNRIATYDGEGWSSTRGSNSVVAPDGTVWLNGSEFGVEQWDGVDLVRHLEDIWTGAIFVGPDGTVGVESWDGTRLYDGTDWNLIARRGPGRALTPDGVLAVPADDRKGVMLYGGGESATVLEGTRINSMAAAPDGSLWIAGSVPRNRGVVYRIDPSQVFAAQATTEEPEEGDEAEPAEDATSG